MRLLLRLGLALLLSLALRAQSGTLVIAGGGRLPEGVFETFLAASGGKGARIAVLPTASGEPKESAQAMVERLLRLGARPLVVDPRSPAEAEASAQREDVKACTGYWFTGGDQNRLVDRIGGTALHRLLKTRYREGAAIGGTSAGAAMMSEVMLVGTDEVSATAPGTYRTRPGLGFLPGALVDQHFLRRSRHNRLLSLAMDHPGLLGLGIDEETALVVKAGRAEVVGRGRVLVLDPAAMTTAAGTFRDLKVHLLGQGQGLDLGSRAVQ